MDARVSKLQQLNPAFLLAINSTAVDYAQIIRSYSLVILLVIASSFFFVKLIAHPKEKATDSWPYVIASTLAVYSQYARRLHVDRSCVVGVFPEPRTVAQSDRIGRHRRTRVAAAPPAGRRQLSWTRCVDRAGAAQIDDKDSAVPLRRSLLSEDSFRDCAHVGLPRARMHRSARS